MERLAPSYFTGYTVPAGMVVAFLGGLLSSASPCVIAALPAACAMTSAVPVNKRLAVVVAFTLGTTLSLTALGILTAYIGRALAFGMRPLSILFGGALIFAGLLMGGWMPGFGRGTCSLVPRRAAVSSSFAFGLLFGSVMTPCATPMLIAILGLLAAGSDPVRGGLLMLSYSLGHCALIFAAGLSWHAVQGLLQRHSAGLEALRKAGGILMCLAGALLIYSVV